LYVGARGPKTIRLAAELADGLLLTSSTPPEGVRAARELVDEVRGDRPFQVVLNLLIDEPGALTDRVAAAQEAGADVVVLEPPDDAPDPEPLLAALRA
jgi:hypothetical protein